MIAGKPAELSVRLHGRTLTGQENDMLNRNDNAVYQNWCELLPKKLCRLLAQPALLLLTSLRSGAM